MAQLAGLPDGYDADREIQRRGSPERIVTWNDAVRLQPQSSAVVGNGGLDICDAESKMKATIHRIRIWALDPPTRLLFLPGASGNTEIWRPVAERLRHGAERIHQGWPGFGGERLDSRVQGFDDLLQLVLERLDRPTAVIAQSMGGVLALQAALAAPHRITHLVLAVTSGGLPMVEHGAEDWREAFAAAHPQLPDWFDASNVDLSDQLPALTIPTLLLWGDADPISPVEVGKRLASRLPDAHLVILSGGTHDLAMERAQEIAPLIDRHLST
ncbi:2-succinyl-6-hydroxy-2,4-cyclohexadiene-1-carboxylate synthase [Synechococcus sp. CBW1107]|nr:2-succinyl-6-hydroxy-2,4-cyclohexadiene-1-carboxylate synthase [Synechococcus sp. CBW1107]